VVVCSTEGTRWLPVVALLAGVALIAGGVYGEGKGAHASIQEYSTPADPYRIVEDETVLAVVVQTTGIASRFAPDHLIYAGAYELTLDFDPDRPEEARFSGQVRVADLVVDEPAMQEELEPRLLELGILDDSYDEMSGEDRESVRASMLAQDQLDVASYPVIEVEALELHGSGNGEFPWTITGALTVRGERAEVSLQARMEHEDERVQIEAHGPLRFTDLGIDPYSAFLGTVRNRDQFHLYLNLVGESAADE
jgi:polyisoprenoid-binding protein YceI